MKKLIFLLFCFNTMVAMAQPKKHTVSGEYDLQGVHEIGSGFIFNADGSFEFFLHMVHWTA